MSVGAHICVWMRSFGNQGAGTKQVQCFGYKLCIEFLRRVEVRQIGCERKDERQTGPKDLGMV